MFFFLSLLVLLRDVFDAVFRVTLRPMRDHNLNILSEKRNFKGYALNF